MSGSLYGFLGYFGTKIIQEQFSITAMLFWRFLVAACWMLPLVIKKHMRAENFLILDIKMIIYLVVFGTLTYAGSSIFYFIASQYTGTGLAMVIFFSYPILVVLFSWIFYKSPLTITMMIALIAMGIGLFMLQQQSISTFNTTGIFFGVLGATFYAIYVIGGKHITSKSIDANTMTFVVSLGCAIFFLCMSFSQHQFSMPHTSKSIIFLLALGILATAIPIQLMLLGLKHISSMRASLISVIEPIVTILIGVLWLDETISVVQWVGACILLTSAILIQFERQI